MIVQTSAVTDGLVAMLRTGLDSIQVGDGKAPDDAKLPYLLVYQVPSPRPIGGKTQPEALRWLKYQFTAVGEQRDQADRTMDRATGLVLEVEAGEYSTAIPVDRHVVIGRRMGTDLGGGNDDLFTRILHLDLLVNRVS